MSIDVSKYGTRLPLEYDINKDLAEGVKTTKDVNFGLKNLITKPCLGSYDHTYTRREKLLSHVEEKNQDVPQQE